ncbi:MAG: 2-C-methyl-D-erythritol 4-phosphate cytidylyltransferase [Lachnospiraceae bacterium]
MEENITAIVLAAGSGNRMHQKTKKQYLQIKSKPVLYYSLRAFEESIADNIIVVTGETEIQWVRETIIERYGFKKVSQIVAGGQERFQSVYQGLKAAKGSTMVLIHDGARPLVSQEIITNSVEGVRKYGAVIAAVPVIDTIKQVDEQGVIINTPDRRELMAAQTPQSFEYELIKSAYDKMMSHSGAILTDDSMVLEYYGHHKVRIIEGSYRNMKVTIPEDLALLENYLG